MFDSHPHILTSTVFYRALIVPIYAQLFWLFSMCDLNIGKVYYNVAIAVPIQALLLVLTAVITYLKTKPVHAEHV